jgi:hypothetical protein
VVGNLSELLVKTLQLRLGLIGVLDDIEVLLLDLFEYKQNLFAVVEGEILLPQFVRHEEVVHSLFPRFYPQTQFLDEIPVDPKIPKLLLVSVYLVLDLVDLVF